MPSSVVYDIIQDSLGYIWIATEYGVSRYDGYSFYNYTIENGLPANSNILIFRGKGNTIWFLTYSGKLSYTAGTNIIPYQFNDTIPGLSDMHFSRTLNVDRNNYVWFRYGQDTNKSVRISDKLDISIKDTFLKRRTNFSQIFRTSLESKSIPVDKTPPFFIVNHGKEVYEIYGKYYYLDNENRLVYAGNKLPAKQKTDFDASDTYCENDGTVWLRKKWDGVYIYNLNYLNSRPLQILPDVRVTKILKDMNGCYWICTEGSGLYYLPSVKFYNYGKTQGLTNANIISLEINGNDLYFATNDEKLFVSRLTEQAHLQSVKELIKNEFKYGRDILYHSDDQLWIIASRYLRYTPEGKPMPLKYSVLKKSYELHECKNSDVVVAMLEGFVRYNNSGLVYDSRTDGFIKHVRAIYESDDETIWLGAMDGLYSFDGTKFTYWGDTLQALETRITSIRGVNEQIWIGTRSNGLVVICKDSIMLINKEDGLSSNMIRSVHKRKNNEIWIGTTDGLNRIMIEDKGRKLLIKNYEIWDGLASNEINDINVFKNYMIIATNQGICTFNPEKIETGNIAPPLHITGIKVNNENIAFNKKMKIGDTANSIIIDYLGINFNDPGNVLYKYKINWHDKNHSPFSVNFRETQEWTETKNTSLQLNTIPGFYEIEIKAANRKNKWTNPLSIRFELEKPLSQQLWFHIVIIVLVIIAVSLVFIILMRNKKRKEQIKTNLLLSEQKALRAQMNPHFIFNSLNSIQDFILERDDEKADLYLASFASLMRKVLENSKHNLIPLSEEIDTLKRYLQLEHLRFQNKFEYHIEIDDDIDTEITFMPPSLLQPYLENAIWHGLMPKKTPGKLIMGFRKISGKQLLIIIQDNGVGREASSQLKHKSKHHKSTGMKNIEERLQLLNKYSKGAYSVKIEDLKNDAGKASGTRIELIIPLYTDEM